MQRAKVTGIKILLAVGLVACGSEAERPPVVCIEPVCTDAERQQAFERAVEELGAEGVEITPESADDPVAYQALFVRYGQLTGAPSMEATARYDSSRPYCGPDGYVEVNPGDCMNRVCYIHDRCYDEIANLRAICPWSAQTDFCDDQFFNGYQVCAASGECGVACHSVAAIAIGLDTMCSNPILTRRPWIRLACATQGVLCDDCVGLDTSTLCFLRPAQCSTILDGCGRPHDCGTCAPGQQCVPDVEEQSAQCTTCPGTPACSAHGTCRVDTRMCACDPGWTGADCSVPDAPPCGNGVCGAGETCTSCPQDCGACPVPCGDSACEAGEDCQSCPQDCGACPEPCGNNVCGVGENCQSCPQDCGPCTCGCTDDDHDSHYPTFCTDPTCGLRDDCDPDNATVYGGAPELCDHLDNGCNVVIDDNDGCWLPVYRFWNLAAPASARPRCYANTASVPAACAGYTLEEPGPVFFVYASPGVGRVEFLAFDRSTDHLLVRAGTSEAAALSAPGSGWTLRGSIGYFWADTANPPPGLYHRPPGALSSQVRELRRYHLPSAGIHLFTNNPAEPVAGWTFEQTRAWVWSSRW